MLGTTDEMLPWTGFSILTSPRAVRSQELFVLKMLFYLKQEFKNLLGPIERDLKDPACLKKRSFYLSVKQRNNAQPPL